MNEPFRADLVLIESAVERSAGALLGEQRPDGHWVYQLETDASISAEYVLLTHYLGEDAKPELERKIAVYLRRRQNADGGWPLYPGGPCDLSATVRAYFALKMIGDPIEAPHMSAARRAILERGGAMKANVFTRILLALFGDISWDAVPALPVELVLLPRWFPVHLSRMSSWARSVVVPLLFLATERAKARNPRAVHVPELFVPGSCPPGRAAHQNRFRFILFDVLDRAIRKTYAFWPAGLRRRAVARCIAWITERANGNEGIGAIYPAMAYSLMLLDRLGFGPANSLRRATRKSIDRLLVIGDEEAYCQPCVSPVWDTALACHALMESRDARVLTPVRQALAWLKERQILEVKGDWAESRPAVRPGGWAFQYVSPHYPDLDDTAVVAVALDRGGEFLGRRDEYVSHISRAVDWIAGLQSENGGWGAFDADNTADYLNDAPFADHGALIDPPTDDVTGHCLSVFGQLGISVSNPIVAHSLRFLRQTQRPDGSWYGRWGVNFIYGTWSALSALNIVGIGSADASVQRAVNWLISIQNEDGGWGEDCSSYERSHEHHKYAPSTPSQTAWALLALMAAGHIEDASVSRGIRYLLRSQTSDGLWDQTAPTGSGFPRVLYLRYHGYPKYFPLLALARYRNLINGNSRKVTLGF